MRLLRSAAAQRLGLAEVAAADEAFAGALGEGALERALDPSGYLGESAEIARRVANDADRA
jgi:adenylosuccinate lyase